jgi:nucleotidyltransferase/DNA polymerase involved in DNA repair
MSVRKIVHIDMDAFYASVEQRDDPQLRGKPVIVAWRGNRSVVCAASYEARRFGVRSAMPAVRAERLCPDGIFLPPDFVRYRAVSRTVREIFKRHTDLVEPLSLDEAYLDVTENKTGLPTATRVASVIREQIRQELNLTASAGVAPNKFLAKIASDWRKPDGLFVIQPGLIRSERLQRDLDIKMCRTMPLLLAIAGGGCPHILARRDPVEDRSSQPTDAKEKETVLVCIAFAVSYWSSRPRCELTNS